MSSTLEVGRARVDELHHHGVLGMKWGHHLRTVGSETKTIVKDIGFELHTGSPSNKRQIAESANKKFEASLPALKAKHGASADLVTRIKNPLSKESKAYRKDARDTLLTHLETAANEQVNASGTSQRTLSTTAPGIKRTGKFKFQIVERTHPNTHKYLWDVRTRDVAHADDVWMTMEPQFDDDGFITSCKPANNSMAQAEDLIKEFLEHHGVLGMKWGHRKASEVTTQTHTHPVTRKTKVSSAGGHRLPAHADAIKAAEHQRTLKSSGHAALSNKELRDLITRRQLEAQATQVTTRRGQKFAQKQLESEGQQQLQKGLRDVSGTVKKVKRAGAVAATVAALS